jgi:hypothetical protein
MILPVNWHGGHGRPVRDQPYQALLNELLTMAKPVLSRRGRPVAGAADFAGQTAPRGGIICLPGRNFDPGFGSNP